MTQTDVALYRALNKSEFPDTLALVVNDVPVDGILYPQFVERQFTANGVVRTRAPDVTVTTESGVNYVSAGGGGTSLFDKAFVFGNRYWRSFTIPNGTEIPDSLSIVKGNYSTERSATHYQIEVRAGRMEVDAFKGALDNLARNAVVKLCEKGKAEAKE